MKPINSKKTALLLTGIILIFCLISSIILFSSQWAVKDSYTAHIYVDGELYQTISLAEVTVSHSFTLNSEDGGYNTIQVQPGAISITAADCPDQICVKQGTIRNALLPITCLPHSLVIELKPTTETTGNNAPDMITH